jgi:hypothetical protein
MHHVTQASLVAMNTDLMLTSLHQPLNIFISQANKPAASNEVAGFVLMS